jgi:ABC-type multidrug transport system fused ATPase/permease subunit
VGRTVIVIAHRLSTTRHAAQIVVMAGGQIRDVGTHDELMSKSTIYRQLVDRQLMSRDVLSAPTEGQTSEA